MITDLEPDILECEVKWALGSITTNKASGDDGIPVELFQILKDDAVKMLHSICQQIWKTRQWPQNGKGQFSFQSQRKAMPKNAQITAQLHSFHTLVMLKILQARLQQYVNRELLDIQAGDEASNALKRKCEDDDDDDYDNCNLALQYVNMYTWF